MKLIVQQTQRKLFLRADGKWTPLRSEANECKTVVEAINFCIRCHAREVRVSGQNQHGQEVCFYPFGGDPAVKAERKSLRRNIRESQRLKAERQAIRARLDSLSAEGKEVRKQFPFKRNPFSEE